MKKIILFLTLITITILSCNKENLKNKNEFIKLIE